MSLEQRYNQAVRWMQEGQVPRAQEELRSLLEIEPNNGYLWGTLGLAYINTGAVLGAEDSLRKAVRFDPRTSIWKEQLGYLLTPLGKVEEALEAVRGLETAGADLVRAFAYEYIGGYSEALQSLLEAEKKAEQATFVNDGRSVPPEVWRVKALILKARCYRRLGLPKKAVKICDEFLAREVDMVAEAAFEKAFAHDALKEWEEAWAFFEVGNSRRTLSFDLARFKGQREMEKSAVRTHRSTRDGSHLVFIVGIPRSGTSLVEQILAQHKKVIPMGERIDLSTIVQKLGGAGWPDLLPEQLNYFADMYLGETLPTEKGQLVTDKLPENWRYAGLIDQLFPGAKIIHCVRQAEDVLLSCFQQNFSSSGMGWTTSVEGLRTYYEEWAKTEVPGYQLSYEELVHEPEKVIRELLEYLGLPFEEDCLYPDRSDRVVATASYAQVKRPITPSSVGKGRNYMEWLAEALPR